MKKQVNTDDENPGSFFDLKLFRLEQHLQSRLREFDALSPEDQKTARPIAAKERALLKKVKNVFSKAGRDEADMHNHIEAVWEHYIYTQQPEALASYIELGGIIDNDVRTAIIKRLREGPPKNKGSRNNIRDIETYMEIKDIRFGITKSEYEGPVKTLKRAREIFMKQHRIVLYEDDTIRKRYSRGRELLGDKKGK